MYIYSVIAGQPEELYPVVLTMSRMNVLQYDIPAVDLINAAVKDVWTLRYLQRHLANVDKRW